MSGASARIRASIEALPSWARREWHHHDQGEHAAGVTTSPLATAIARSDLTGGFAQPVAAYIALMGPHVGEKVAALLEAITSWGATPQGTDEYRAACDRLQLRRFELESAIEQGGQR